MDEAAALYLFCLASRDSYEPLNRYTPGPEFLVEARSSLPLDWRLERVNVFYNCRPPRAITPDQGWKIHVSATPTNAAEILRQVAASCSTRGASFKFIADMKLLKLSIAKRWGRSAAGKFVTIYPRDTDECRSLMDELGEALRGHAGPYILSDRRYRDSKVVHYRYGGIRAVEQLDVTGYKSLTIQGSDGVAIVDERVPYWVTPPGVEDPFIEEAPPSAAGSDGAVRLHNGRFIVNAALRFSATGGVYGAVDARTDQPVVIKEARPETGHSDIGDAQARLRREFEMQREAAEVGISPTPLELFSDWEHLFIAMARVDGVDLTRFALANDPLFLPSPSRAEVDNYLDQLDTIFQQIIGGVRGLHARGVAFGDLSPTNVLVEESPSSAPRAWLIDFEAAFKPGLEAPSGLTTYGYSRGGGRSEPFADDIFAIAAMYLACFLPVNSIFVIDPDAWKRFVPAILEDLGVDGELTKSVMAVLESPTVETLDGMAAAIAASRTTSAPSWSVNPISSFEDLLGRTVENLLRHADLTRRDRLFPADSAIFGTNPLSLAYGAAGVLFAANRLDVLDPRHVTWLLDHDVSGRNYPPGLYLGSAGIGCVLAELGYGDVAVRMVGESMKHPLLDHASGVLYGRAGIGLACLSLFGATADDRLVAWAQQLGDALIADARRDERGWSWAERGEVRVGYGRGASGVALFFLYLAEVTGSAVYLEAGRNALAFDLAQGVATSTGHISFPRVPLDGNTPDVLSHYLMDGSAGIISVAARYWYTTRAEEYRYAVEQSIDDLARKYVSFPGLFSGLAGLGDALLDCAQFLDRPDWLQLAERVATGLSLFAVPVGEGVVWPGDQLLRPCADLATGSAGIALFLQRLTAGGSAFNFGLDEVLTRAPAQR